MGQAGPEGTRDGMEDGPSMAQSFEDGAKMGRIRAREVSKMAQRGPIERTQDGRESSLKMLLHGAQGEAYHSEHMCRRSREDGP